MSLTFSPPKPLEIAVDYNRMNWAPKKIKKTARIVEPKNLDKIASHYHLSPVKPIVEETDIDDLLGADDGVPSDRVLERWAIDNEGNQILLFSDGTWEKA